MQHTTRSSRILFLTAIILCSTSSVLFSVEDVIVLPKTGHRKPPITFSHKAHSTEYGASCTDCHHTGKNVKCSTCHLLRDKGAIINLKGAFHQQCLGCHRKTSGPKGCSRCHHAVRR